MAGTEELAAGYMANGLHGVSEVMIEMLAEIEGERCEVWRRSR